MLPYETGGAEVAMAGGTAARVARTSGGFAPSTPFPFVLLHGAGADADRFDALLPRLADAVAVDLPGHGGAGGPARREVAAYAADVAALARREGWVRPIVVGHSMGGAIALALALDGGLELGGLGLVATGARLRVHPDVLAALAEGRLPPALPGWMFGPSAPPDMVAGERGALEAAAASGALYADMAACDAFDVTARLGELRLPAAVVVGDADRMTPPRLAEALVAGWGRREAIALTLVAGAGHYVVRERPDAVAEALGDLRRRARAAMGE
jgi:pimeloyl-ACP methyl ester carboxylesterase